MYARSYEGTSCAVLTGPSMNTRFMGGRNDIADIDLAFMLGVNLQ
jgi:hypothetical protein